MRQARKEIRKRNMKYPEKQELYWSSSSLPNSLTQNTGATFPKPLAVAAGTVHVLLSKEQEMPLSTICHNQGGCLTS